MSVQVAPYALSMSPLTDSNRRQSHCAYRRFSPNIALIVF